MPDRFDLEQEIMRCWSVVEDIRTLVKMNSSTEKFEALATIYDIKFDSLFNMFEEMIKEKKIT